MKREEERERERDKEKPGSRDESKTKERMKRYDDDLNHNAAGFGRGAIENPSQSPLVADDHSPFNNGTTRTSVQTREGKRRLKRSRNQFT